MPLEAAVINNELPGLMIGKEQKLQKKEIETEENKRSLVMNKQLKGGTCATFTVAGDVRRSLADAGFSV